MKSIKIILALLIITQISCTKKRVAGEQDEELKLSPNFVANTTPIHVLSNSIDINECFYKNNYIKLVGYDPRAVEYSWYKCYPEEGLDDEFLTHDSVFITSLDGEYRLDAEMNIFGIGEVDTSVYITLDHCPTYVEISETFIPNGDGQFDTWFPIFSGVSEFYVRVTDDNSNIVFESTTEDEVFNGKYNGSKLPAGSYHYYVSGTYRSGYIFEQQGVIELVR